MKLVVNSCFGGFSLSTAQVVEIPDNSFYEVQEYDGSEAVVWSSTETQYA
jgi:hypothetical protein